MQNVYQEKKQFIVLTNRYNISTYFYQIKFPRTLFLWDFLEKEINGKQNVLLKMIYRVSQTWELSDEYEIVFIQKYLISKGIKW